MKTKIMVVVFALVLLLPISFASAYDIKTSQQTATVDANQTIQDDLMIAGQTVTIDGIVTGDVYAAGSTVNVNGTVKGNLFVAGSNVNISGTVEGDLFAAGANISITGSAKKGIMAFGGMISVEPKTSLDANNATFMGGTVTIGKNANFAKDVIINGGSILMNGSVGNNLTANAGTVDLSGKVANDAKITASQNLTVSSTAQVNGKLDYKAPKVAQVNDGAKISGETKFTQLEKKENKKHASSGMFAFTMFSFITNMIAAFGLLVVSIITAAVGKNYTLKTLEQLENKTWASLGWGALILIATPIAMIILFITILGIPISFLVLSIYLVLMYFAMVFASICTGYYIIKAMSKKEPNLVWSAILGVIILSIIMMIPFIGMIAKFFIECFGLGAMVLAMKAYKKTSLKKV